MIFPCWLCREILKLFLVVLLRVVFRLYEGRGVGFSMHSFTSISTSWRAMAVISNGMVMGEVVRGPFSRELVKHPLGVGGSAFSFVSQ